MVKHSRSFYTSDNDDKYQIDEDQIALLKELLDQLNIDKQKSFDRPSLNGIKIRKRDIFLYCIVFGFSLSVGKIIYDSIMLGYGGFVSDISTARWIKNFRKVAVPTLDIVASALRPHFSPGSRFGHILDKLLGISERIRRPNL